MIRVDYPPSVRRLVVGFAITASVACSSSEDVADTDTDTADPIDTRESNEDADSTGADGVDCITPRAGCPCEPDDDEPCCMGYSHLLDCDVRYIPSTGEYVELWVDVWDGPECEARPHPTLPLCDWAW